MRKKIVALALVASFLGGWVVSPDGRATDHKACYGAALACYSTPCRFDSESSGCTETSGLDYYICVTVSDNSTCDNSLVPCAVTVTFTGATGCNEGHCTGGAAIATDMLWTIGCEEFS